MQLLMFSLFLHSYYIPLSSDSAVELFRCCEKRLFRLRHVNVMLFQNSYLLLCTYLPAQFHQRPREQEGGHHWSEGRWPLSKARQTCCWLEEQPFGVPQTEPSLQLARVAAGRGGGRLQKSRPLAENGLRRHYKGRDVVGKQITFLRQSDWEGLFRALFTLAITIHSFLLVTLGFPRCRGGPETVADRTGKPVRSGKTPIL